MQARFFRLQMTLAMVLLALAVGVGSSFVFVGCTEDLSGEIRTNQPPTVEFVNIPPEDQKFSRNPVIYWSGRDVDGQIIMYRYHVATIDDMAGSAPAAYIATVDSSAWTYLHVNPTAADPQTQDIVPMTADLENPVDTFVVQYVFLQAVDEELGMSEIVWRKFARNDNPPQTQLLTIPSTQLPFVNAEAAGGIITGVKVRWRATDPIDYPSDPPPFDFRWKLFGPYDDTTLERLEEEFTRQVYVTIKGDILNAGDTIEVCDTTIDADTLVITCRDVPIEEGVIEEELPAFGKFETLFEAESEEFINSDLYKPVDSSIDPVTQSVWTKAVGDTIYDVYRNFDPPAPADTSVQLNFLFWVVSRDDALVEDLVPAFRSFPVLNPKFERDVAVLDFSGPVGFGITAGVYEKRVIAKGYWYDALKKWDDNIQFDTSTIQSGDLKNHSPDYFFVPLFSSGIPLSELLKHKVLILYNESYSGSGFVNLGGPVYRSIDAGVNVWLTMRAPVEGAVSTPVISDLFLLGFSGAERYSFYFGATAMPYSGWICQALRAGPCQTGMQRIEDFVEAVSLQPERWPDVSLDKDRLIGLIDWSIIGRPKDTDTSRIGLPEVDWSARLTPGTEVLYLYGSAWGANHPNGIEFSFDGSPIAHRRNTGFFRTVHFNFTPMVMDTAQMQIVIDSVMNWLYEDNLTEPTAKVRYPEAAVQMSLSEARAHYLRWTEETAEPADPYYTNERQTDKSSW